MDERAHCCGAGNCKLIRAEIPFSCRARVVVEGGGESIVVEPPANSEAIIRPPARSTLLLHFPFGAQTCLCK